MILFWNFCLLAFFSLQLMCKKAGAEDTEVKNELNERQSDTEESIVNNAHNQSSDILIRRRRQGKNGNVALNRPTTQSSTIAGGGASSLAVDGNTKADGGDYHTCTHTQLNENGWWAVDLGRDIAVTHVRITNRADCCAERLKNFYIGMTNVSPWTTKRPVLEQGKTCYYYPGSPRGGIPTDIYCDIIVQGQYLFVMLSKPDALTICELEVFEYSFG